MKKRNLKFITLLLIMMLSFMQMSVFAEDSVGDNIILPNELESHRDYENIFAPSDSNSNVTDNYSYKLTIEPSQETGYGYMFLEIEQNFEEDFSYYDTTDPNNIIAYGFNNIPESLLTNKNLALFVFIKTENVFIQDEVARVNNEDIDPSDNDRFGAYFSTLDKNNHREFSEIFLSGTNDWTLVKINVDPLNYFYPNGDGTGKIILNPVLHLGNQGNQAIGTAWFDLSLIQLTENAPIVSATSDYGFVKETAEMYLQDNLSETIYLNYSIPEQYDNENYDILFEENNNGSLYYYLDIVDNPDMDNLVVNYRKDIPRQNAATSVMIDIVEKSTGNMVFTDIILIYIYDEETSLSVSPGEVHLDMDADDTTYETQQLIVNPSSPDVRFESLNPAVATVTNNDGTNYGGLVQAIAPGETTIVVTLGDLRQEVTVYINQIDAALNSSAKTEIQEAYDTYLADIVDEDSDKLFEIKETLNSTEDSEIEVLASDDPVAVAAGVQTLASSKTLATNTASKVKDKEIAYKVVNFIRAVSGLNPVKANLTYENYADAGLLYLAKNNLKISHTAARDSGNNLANIGLSNSNLTSRTGSANVYYDPNEMIYAFLIDIGDNNLYKAGHRRWLLNDVCDEMGFAEEQSADTKTSYGALYVLSDNGKEANVTTFPSAGDFPVEMITDFYNGNFTWSIMLGDKYKLDASKTINVSIRRRSDGKTVSYKKVNENQVNANTDWYSIVTEIVGNGQGININPASFINGNVNSLLGNTYDVSVSGPGINGVNSSLNYSVHFYSMKSDNTKKVDATKITIDQSNVSLGVNENTKLTVTLTPKNATNEITWTSRNPAVATINENGVVTGVAEGVAQILVQTDNKLTAMTTVKIVKSNSNSSIKATKIDVVPNDFTMVVGDSRPVIASIQPATSSETVTWSIADSSVATINKSGQITAKKAGSTTITATTSTSKLKATAKLNVVKETERVSATGIKLALPTSLTSGSTTPTMNTGETVLLSYTLTPNSATDKVTWSVANSTIAKISDLGELTALKAGTTTVKGTTTSGKTAQFTLKVLSKQIYVTKIDAGIKALSLRLGKTYQLKTTIYPSNATNKAITYEVANKGIVSVTASGLVKGLRNGTTTIYIKSKDGGATTAIDVVVSANANLTDNTMAPGEDNENVENNNSDSVNTDGTNPAGSENNNTDNVLTNNTLETTNSGITGTNTVGANQNTITNNTTKTATTSTNITSPKTGITEDLVLVWIVLIILAISICLITYLKRKKIN